jgi:enterochelin esterase-like enzyme
MPDGYAAPLSMPMSSSASAAAVAERARNSAAFERDLLEDILPFVAAGYRVRDEASSRALVGLAIGGAQSLTIGLNHPEEFAWVGGFSAVPFDPATAIAAALADPKATDAALRLVWIACGKNDRLVENARLLSGVLKVNGIRHELQDREDGHRWSLWRRYLAELLPLLFVTKP